MFVADTNVLLYAADTSSPGHNRCRSVVDGWRRSNRPWHLTWPIIYEFLRVATHPRVFRTPWSLPLAWSFVRGLLAASRMSVLTATPQHDEVLEEIIGTAPTISGNIMHDAHTVVLMREHGVRTIYTRDTDFHRFQGIEVLDPMSPPD